MTVSPEFKTGAFKRYVLTIGKLLDEHYEVKLDVDQEYLWLMKIGPEIMDFYKRNISAELAYEFIALKCGLVKIEEDSEDESNDKTRTS